MGIEKHFPVENILYVQYELLKNKNTRVAEITRVRDFILGKSSRGSWDDEKKLPSSTTTKFKNSKFNSSNEVTKAMSDEHVECAFTLAENPHAHRHVSSEDKNLYMTKNIAYTKELTCRMWMVFEKYATTHGYVSRDFDCSTGNYEPVPLTAVGAQV